MNYGITQFETRSLRLELARRRLCADGVLPYAATLSHWLRELGRSASAR